MLKNKSKKLLSIEHINRLREFIKKKRLRKTVLTFLASRATDDEIKEQVKIFHAIDSNHDGYITIKELTKALKNKLPPEEIQDIMNSVDTDKNGAINFNEFIAATLEPSMTKDIGKLIVHL